MKFKMLTAIQVVFLFILVGCGGGGSSNNDTIPPKFITPNKVSIQENKIEIIKIQLKDDTPITYSIIGGDDKSLFKINFSSGMLSFIHGMDYENPLDADSNNSYNVIVRAKDSAGNKEKQNIEVIVTDIDDTPPIFTSATDIDISENHVKVLTLKANDTSTVKYTIEDGDDASTFIMLDSRNGDLRFKSAPNYENPKDTDSDNVYNLTVTATDSEGNSANQQIKVTVKDIDENSNNDADNDRIPDNIELLIGSAIDDNDMNQNGIDDGLDINGTYGDTFFYNQWHIWDYEARYTNKSDVKTVGGNDLGVIDIYHHYMGYNKGNNIVVQVVDTGVDANHEDLYQNMDISLSYDNSNIGCDPSPNSKYSGYTHGTMVAGIIAARAFNGKGVRGIAPFANIAGSNWLESQSSYALEKIWLTDNIAIVNNSWGIDYDTDTLYEDIMQKGVTTLRGGKGKIYVFAAGNSRKDRKNSNLQYYLSNRYSIAVAALKNDNTHADYSTPGSNILVSGYSGDHYQNSPTIGTTTIMGKSSLSTTWDEDKKRNYTFAMNGTSAASPTVSASIALVLEACPQLAWRDVKYLIAKNAIRIDSENDTWVKNSARLWHSTDYGFGLINAKGMIDECTNSNFSLLAAEKETTVSKIFNRVIEDETTESFDLNVTDNLTVEWIEVTVDNNNSSAQDYKVKLISPNGSPKTETTLMTAKTSVYGDWMNGGFRFGTPAMMGEPSQGIWKVELSDEKPNKIGTLKNIKITIYGH